MKPSSTAALAFLVAAAPAFAGTVTLDFEGAAGYVNSIGEFYNGGTDSLGQSGPHHGVSFTPAAVALSNSPGFDYYSNAPTPGTVMFAFDSTAVMNVAQGFVDLLTFHYSAGQSAPDAVNVYSGLDGTGTLLASASLAGNAQAGCSDTPYCHFDLASVAFTGLAKSVGFGGNAPDVVFDNITITAIPEPATHLLTLAAGLAAVAVTRRRRNA